MKKNDNILNKESSVTLNLNRELDKKEMQKENISIQLMSTNLVVSFYNLFKFSQIIQNEYLHNDIINRIMQKILYLQKNHHIKEESIILFFNIIQGENVTVHCDQYCDLCTLSDLFEVKPLQNWLKNYMRLHINDIDFIINLFIERQSKQDEYIFIHDNYSVEMENCLKVNIIKCLQNPKFGKLNLPFIYRIIEKSDQKQIPSDLLYDFISESIEERFLLFTFLDIKSLSDEKFDHLCTNYTKNPKHFYQYLSNDLLYIKSLKDANKSIEYQLKSHIKELEKKNYQLQTQNTELINKNKQLNIEINQFQSQIKQLIDYNNQNKERINELSKENNFLKTKIIELNEEKEKMIRNKEESPCIKKIIETFAQNVNEINNIRIDGKNALIYAYNEGSIELVKFLFSLKKFNINSKDYSGKTILHYACRAKDIEIIKYIVSLNQFDFNSKDYSGKTILYDACESKDIDIIRYIISLNKIDINSKDSEDKTVLHYACKSGNLDIVRTLLSNNYFDFNAKDKSGKNILHYSCESCNTDLVKYIISLNRIDINSKDNLGKTFLHYGCESGNVELVKYLVSLNKIDFNSIDNNGKTILHSACKSGSVDLVEYIISFSIIDMKSKDKNGRSILFDACESSNTDVIKYIISFNQIDVNQKDNFEKTILHYACELKKVNVVKYLISLKNIDINSQCSGKTPLYIAVENCNTEIVRVLITSQNIDVNFKYEQNKIEQFNYSSHRKNYLEHNEYPILYTAVNKGNIEIVNILLSNDNIDINCYYMYKREKDEWKDEYRYIDECKEFMQYQIPALYLAVKNRQNEIVRSFLAKQEIDVNCKYIEKYDYRSKSIGGSYYDGKNIEEPIICLAVENNYIEGFLLLLSNERINLNSKYFYEKKSDKKVKTPLHIAVENNRLEIVQLLLQHNEVDVNAKDEKNKRPIECAHNELIKKLFINK